MKEYAVVGASSGTGLAITRLLASQGHTVRAIARKPPAATELIKPVVADVGKPEAIAAALAGELEAVFFTVDIHKAFASKPLIRSVMFDGFVNVLNGVQRHAKPPRIVLLSVMGPGKSSLTWHLLNLAKRGMQKNIVDREQALVDSGLPYVILRAPRLVDVLENEIETTRSATAAMLSAKANHRLDMKRTIARPDLAAAMVAAAISAPENSVWDVYANDAGPVPAWLR
ncbi:NAD(P)H-binding protein [Undibacterium pigrum]|uniref:Putative NAD(P)-binding protein n=1 Tax=Undibacterium pigrum TaxID=401470 RepID=A0A318IT75_9BURK|nr:NAD(P)H-binding protein [Undibacterium pigrum]PXX37820.1 putative NAD(P)-binding protein [Undibacterium pigrum]